VAKNAQPAASKPLNAKSFVTNEAKAFTLPGI
jgi:hypothetical protein